MSPRLQAARYVKIRASSHNWFGPATQLVYAHVPTRGPWCPPCQVFVYLCGQGTQSTQVGYRNYIIKDITHTVRTIFSFLGL